MILPGYPNEALKAPETLSYPPHELEDSERTLIQFHVQGFSKSEAAVWRVSVQTTMKYEAESHYSFTFVHLGQHCISSARSPDFNFAAGFLLFAAQSTLPLLFSPVKNRNSPESS